MVNCLVCNAVLDIEEEDLDEGDTFDCEECAAEIVVTNTSLWTSKRPQRRKTMTMRMMTSPMTKTMKTSSRKTMTRSNAPNDRRRNCGVYDS